MIRRGRLLVALAVAAAAVIAFLLARPGPGRSSQTAAGPAADPGTAAAGPPDRRPPPGAIRNPPPRHLPTGDPAVDFDARELLANFRELTRFPPDSRPLGPEQLDLLHPNARHEGPVPVKTPVRGETFDPDQTYFVHFTGDRYFVTGDETITTTLRVWKGAAGVTGEPVTIDAATAVVVSPAGEEEIAALTYQPARGPDGVTYRNTFSPARAGVTRTGEVQLHVQLTAPDGSQAQGRLEVFYTPAKRVPARFTGRFRERLEEGSLVISAEVEVVTAGRYEIDANLFDAADRPVASAHVTAELEPGKRTVDLLFFGLIFHEQRATGRFTLRTLRGHRFSPGETPDRELMAAFAGSYRTAAYDLDDFSDAEWDSPDKQRQIQMYEDHIRLEDETRPPE